MSKQNLTDQLKSLQSIKLPEKKKEKTLKGLMNFCEKTPQGMMLPQATKLGPRKRLMPFKIFSQNFLVPLAAMGSIAALIVGSYLLLKAGDNKVQQTAEPDMKPTPTIYKEDNLKVKGVATEEDEEEPTNNYVAYTYTPADPTPTFTPAPQSTPDNSSNDSSNDSSDSNDDNQDNNNDSNNDPTATPTKTPTPTPTPIFDPTAGSDPTATPTNTPTPTATPTPATLTNVALNKTTEADLVCCGNFISDRAVDGDLTTFWKNASNGKPHWLKVSFGETYTIEKAVVISSPGNHMAANFKLQYFDGTEWTDISGTNITNNTQENVTFIFSEAITTNKVRFYSTEDKFMKIIEFELWGYQ